MKQRNARIAIASCENLPGWEVDDRPFFDALSKQVEYTILPWSDASVDWSKFDAVLLRTTWDYTERLDEFLAWVRDTAGQTRLLNAAEWVYWNCRKTYLRDLASAGVAIAPSYWLERGGAYNLRAILDSNPKVTQWFLKPVVGATSAFTLRFRGSEVEDAEVFLEEHLAAQAFILQPYLSRVEVEGEYSLLFMGGHFTHGVRKVPVPGDYRVQDDFGAHDERFMPDAQLMTIGHKVIEAAASVTGITEPLLYARLDFLRSDEGVWLLNEFEVIEPSLFFRHDEDAADILVDAVLKAIA